MHKTNPSCGGTYPPPPPAPPRQNDVVFCPTLQPYNRHDRSCRRRAAVSPPFLLTTVVAAASSWLRNRRIRYFFVFLCSPLLLVLLCAAIPFLCAADLCLRRRLWQKILRGSSGDDGGDRLRRCEEGCCWCGGDENEDEKGLLHRYLQDQLLLVGSMYECGDDQGDEEEEDSRRVEDVENLGSSSRLPLLS
ncbi:uncharacterized protein LOC133293697 [Gastrolobium bilobum]|uniref:uncharacterized protein LOC133293697 n=1 Tax=Gastrolobium bilobum TaxID=150636 RepID=UPI002AB2B585|nr:uncharacterized protein LOC133293697 [Gastrolobium bilobum]